MKTKKKVAKRAPAKAKKNAKKSAPKKKASVKTKAKAAPKGAKSAAKPAAKKKGLTIAELFEIKQNEILSRDAKKNPNIAPHDVHDKVNVHARADGAKVVRGPGPGNRHH